MMVLLILLALNAVLLFLIVIMLATGWPLKLRDEIERTSQSLRREMAEQRSESLQFMKSLRIIVEDAVKESVEKEMASSRPRSGRPRKSASSKAQDAAIVQEPVAVEEETDNSTQLSVLQAMQIPLFPDKTPIELPAEVRLPALAEALAETAQKPETIHMGYVDDIPEVE